MKTIGPAFAALRTAAAGLEGGRRHAERGEAQAGVHPDRNDLGRPGPEPRGAVGARRARPRRLDRARRRRRQLGCGEDVSRRAQPAVPELPRRLPRAAGRRHVPLQARFVLTIGRSAIPQLASSGRRCKAASRESAAAAAAARAALPGARGRQRARVPRLSRRSSRTKSFHVGYQGEGRYQFVYYVNPTGAKWEAIFSVTFVLPVGGIGTIQGRGRRS